MAFDSPTRHAELPHEYREAGDAVIAGRALDSPINVAALVALAAANVAAQTGWSEADTQRALALIANEPDELKIESVVECADIYSDLRWRAKDFLNWIRGDRSATFEAYLNSLPACVFWPSAMGRRAAALASCQTIQDLITRAAPVRQALNYVGDRKLNVAQLKQLRSFQSAFATRRDRLLAEQAETLAYLEPMPA